MIVIAIFLTTLASAAAFVWWQNRRRDALFARDPRAARYRP